MKSKESCRWCRKRVDCARSQGADDWCMRFTFNAARQRRWNQILLSAVVVVVAVVLACLFCSCTTRSHYQHKWIDQNNIPQKIDIVWTEGVGNSTKQNFIVILPDRAMLAFGMAVMNQDQLMKVLNQWGITFEKFAEAYMNGPLSAPIYGVGQPSKAMPISEHE